MRDVDDLLDEVYSGQERMTRDDIYRRAVAASMPAEVIVALTALPEGEYAQDEVSESLAQLGEVNAEHATGIAPEELSDDDLLRELGELHRTRHETLRHAPDPALDEHDERTTELEAEYLRRFPEREVDPQRYREGARTRRPHPVTPVEADQQVELAVADEGPASALAASGGPAGAGGSPPPFREPVPAGGPGPRAGTGDPTTSARTGAEQPWDPEDLAIAQGHDPNARNVERARQELARDGRSAIERTVP